MIDAIPFLFNQSYAFIACFYIMKKILCEENAKYFLQFPQNLYVYLRILYHILDIFSNIRIICFKKGLIFQSILYVYNIKCNIKALYKTLLRRYIALYTNYMQLNQVISFAHQVFLVVDNFPHNILH